MLKELKFVQGAVAKKDFVPALTHFEIRDRRITGFNGTLALSCPVDTDLVASPKAVPFIKAIKTCKAKVKLSIKNEKLVVDSGKFKARIECTPDIFPFVAPEGKTVHTTGNMIEALTKVSPFVAIDASRPWACGVLFSGQSAYATNNACIIEFWLGTEFPSVVCIPKEAVNELLRIGEEPLSMQITENSMTFHFKGERWLRTQLLNTEWPNIVRILDTVEGEPVDVPKDFFEAVEDLIPFADEYSRLHLCDGELRTSLNEEEGATVKVDGLYGTGCYSITFMRLLAPVAKKIVFDRYPSPCAFFGDKIRGAIIGMRQ